MAPIDKVRAMCSHRKTLSEWQPLVYCLEVALVSVGNITASIIAFDSMQHVRLDLLQVAKMGSEGARRNVEEFAGYFLSMQFALFAIIFSVIIWTVVTLIELWYKKWISISLVLVATLYTMLMLLTHALALEKIQRITVDSIKRDISSTLCDRDKYPGLCGLDEAGVREYEAAYGMAYASVGFLAVYAVYLLVLRYEAAMQPHLTGRNASSAQQGAHRSQQDHGDSPASISAYENREEWSHPSGGVYS